jgi:molecular chaperone HtpG
MSTGDALSPQLVSLQRFQMEANFEGLIQLLAKNLYPEPDVFVRELIQNSHDSAVLRQKDEPGFIPEIDVSFDIEKRTITFSDNARGMNLDEIRGFLSVIGSTGTGAERESLAKQGRESARKLIGQFGIGMLSAFVVASEVVVRTRRVGSEQAYIWVNRGSQECTVYAGVKDEFGTEVTLSVRESFSYMLDEGRLSKTITRYCDFLPIPVRLNGRGPVNALSAPWHRDQWTSPAEKEEAYEQFIIRHYNPDLPLLVIPIDIDEQFQARGVLYIPDRKVSNSNSTGVIDIFVRRIFLRGNDNSFLPSWAGFVRGVIDSPDLQPTAARDNVQRNENPAFEFLRRRVADLIITRLLQLAEKEPVRFRQVNHWHHTQMKDMAFQNQEAFDQLAGLLLVDTNKGLISLRDYLSRNPRRADKENKAAIYYFVHRSATSQFYRLADARGWVVINGSDRSEERVLEKYAKLNHRTIHLARIDDPDSPDLFESIGEEDQKLLRPLEIELESEIRRRGFSSVLVRTRRFAPTDLPAVLITTPEGEVDEKLRSLRDDPYYMSTMDDVARDFLSQGPARPSYLSLNASNSLIQKLAAIDRREDAVRDVMAGIYQSAVLHSENLLNPRTVKSLHQHLVALLDAVVQKDEKVRKLQQRLDQAVKELAQPRAVEAAPQERADHILLFMITPFGAEYKPLEEAVRRVFETKPYFFELRLARDYTHNSESVLANVREHMRRANGFVAEITELKPNVMFELGAAMVTNGGRPVFALRAATADLTNIPADVGTKLYVSYSSLKDSVEAIEKQIREAFEQGGRSRSDEIQGLLDQRRQKFLSRTLLRSLERLKELEIDALTASYRYVEELVAADSAEVAKRTNLRERVVLAVQDELQQQL